MSQSATQRLRLEISGAVQGVGFRPFVYRRARRSRLAGWVLNDSRGVVVEAEGERGALEAFAEAIRLEPPDHAVLDRCETTWLEPRGLSGFAIRSSAETGDKTVSVLPDLAVCPACLGEVLDPEDRRFGYPFTNCTDCGPRFSIVESLPYDRPHTTMRDFVMCARCRAEYEDPGDRRFHAQPNACAACGPSLELWDATGGALGRGGWALEGAAGAVRDGKILAVKGLGGFHLVVDAADETAVARLRRRKGRYEKPLALMARDVVQASALVEVSPTAADLLGSAGAPIVLLPQRHGARVAAGVAPGSDRLGVMLAYTPLHHLLLNAVGRPVVATSGNLSDEPIATDNQEAVERLGGIADLFLLHDRPIARHVDDSVFHLVEGRPQPLRRARGWAPLPLVGRRMPTILAVGADLKNTVALASGDRVFVSQHIGDMATPAALAAFERVIADFLDLYEARPVAVARDLHPGYHSSLWLDSVRSGRMADRGEIGEALSQARQVAVQHHHAHLAACLADNDEARPALGVVFDGTGYGPDGSIWGGEFLLGDAGGYRRVGSLRPFRLPGAEAAVREPRRVALSLLWQVLGDAAIGRADLPAIRSFDERQRGPLAKMLESGFGSPWTTSAGRLFDAVASLLDLHQTVSFEGQAAMAVELAADPATVEAYPLPLQSPAGDSEDRIQVLDWRPMIGAILDDLRRGVAVSAVAARFHRGLVDGIVEVAGTVGCERVALTGGCFQNRLLSEWAAERLRAEGFRVLMHRRLPPNDGGISFGQAMVTAARLERGD